MKGSVSIDVVVQLISEELKGSVSFVAADSVSDWKAVSQICNNSMPVQVAGA